MKSLTLSLGRLALVVAGALSLGACNRAEYNGLSQSATHSSSTPVASQAAAPYVPVAAEESAVVSAPALAAPSVASVVPSAPTVAAVAPIAPLAAAPVAKRASAPKLNLVQRLALRKVTKKLDKLTAQLPQLKKQDASAARGGLDGNLRSALLFGLVGLILLLFSGVADIFAILGTILLIIGLVFLVLWLLDQA
ncbi:MAG: hypothetical protein ACRYG7_35055 [Janthinobacterium lividum]